MDYSNIRVEKRDQVAIVTLDRPKVLLPAPTFANWPQFRQTKGALLLFVAKP
jgi:enoyl-CoA hydratase/carnithine racemase